MRIAMVVAEASGDNIAANLICTMKAQNPDVEVSGICGPSMIEQGARAIYKLDDIASLGVEGLFSRLHKILKIRRNYVDSLLENPPDVFVGIDAPDFNLSIEERLRKAGIPTLQYVAPTVWAWRGYRIHKLKRAVSQLLTIYPFEDELFDRAGIPYKYIGHPLADQIAARSTTNCREKYGLNEDDRVVALLPGSRTNEVRRLAAIFLQTATELLKSEPNLKFIAPFTSESTHTMFENIRRAKNIDIPVQVVVNDSLGVIEASDIVIAASGTAALESALCGKPVVVSYRVSLMTYWMVRVLSKTRHYSMLNHFDGGPTIPEFMQNECTVRNISRETLKLMSDTGYRNRLLEKFNSVAQQLRCNANQLAAQEIFRLAGQ